VKASEFFLETQKRLSEKKGPLSHHLLLKGGFVHQLSSGLFSLLPIGFRVFHKIEGIIREELNRAGCQEVLMPVVQPMQLWEETGRSKTAGEELLKVRGRDSEYVLAMTHEEVVTDIVRKSVHYWYQLPFILNQIQTKFRDEPRPRGGLLRTREFTMQDAYSFDRTKEGLDQTYNKMVKAYQSIFERLEIPAVKIAASSGIMGGNVSEEFVVFSENGEDTVVLCEKCNYKANAETVGKSCPKCKGVLIKKRAIELAHLFKLGTYYSEKMKAYFVEKNGTKKPILMGCYGMGLERALATIVEIHHDANGIIWPKSTAPFQVHLADLTVAEQQKKLVSEIYNKLITNGIDVLYDDRDKSAGFKLIDADLLGCPYRLIISPRSLSKRLIELKERGRKKTELLRVEKTVELVKSKIKTE